MPSIQSCKVQSLKLSNIVSVALDGILSYPALLNVLCLSGSDFEEGYKCSATALTVFLPTMGHGLPRPNPPSDPYTWPQTAKLRKSAGGGQSLLVGPKSTLYRIPMDPTLRVQIPLDPELDAQVAGGGKKQTGGSIRNEEGFWDMWIDKS